MLLALSLTGAIAVMLTSVEERHLFRIHSKYGCTIDTAVDSRPRFLSVGGMSGHGQFTLPCGQSTTLEDMSDDIRFECVCE
ncbi:hypothetical protein [Archangium lansingense]|uniref:Uncharacterized protein n=2 Tax=Archangium lansingense TaxID=2995310 RepID=A0ABT4ADM3_9BACT|nr:hypothetical protein [Archangium lansinium]MCY1079768.1 hypothetical protein [Archangium lansinium]